MSMEKQIIYQVLPRLWGNGKFSDWKEPGFSYLKGLGVTYLWLTGIPRHASGQDFVKGDPGCPYAIEDWKDTNPYLADNPDKRMSEFKSLVRRAHKAGIKILTDFIPNHVARNYDGPVPVLDRCDYDWTDTRKVDYSDPRTVGEMADILGFWADAGVDGFRCDMVELVPPEAMKAIIDRVRPSRPELLFVAEVYDRNNYALYLDHCGFDLLYDKSGVYDILRGIYGGTRGAMELSWNWQFLGSHQDGMLNFLENHDEQRICSRFYCGGFRRTRASLAFSLLFNRASFLIYSGQELGEDAAESGDGRTSIFNMVKVGSADRIAGIIAGKQPAAEDAEKLGYFRLLTETAMTPAFRSGGVWDLCYCQDADFDRSRLFTFARYVAGEGRIHVVLCNFSPEAAACSINLPQELLEAASGRCGCLTERLEMSAGAYDAAFCEYKIK